METVLSFPLANQWQTPSMANTKVNEVFRRARVNEELHRWVIQRPRFNGRSFTWTHVGFASNNSTSSHKGSPFVLTKRLSNTRPGDMSHIGIDVPIIARRGKLNNLPCGVSFVFTHISQPRTCNALARTSSHRSYGRDWLCRSNLIVRQMVWFARSHCPYPCGW